MSDNVIQYVSMYCTRTYLDSLVKNNVYPIKLSKSFAFKNQCSEIWGQQHESEMNEVSFKCHF